jgi:hypothetical protein
VEAEVVVCRRRAARAIGLVLVLVLSIGSFGGWRGALPQPAALTMSSASTPTMVMSSNMMVTTARSMVVFPFVAGEADSFTVAVAGEPCLRSPWQSHESVLD